MPGQNSLERKQPAVRGALLALINERVEPGLVAFVIDDQGRRVLQIDLAKHIDEVL